jgi:hypothetical protein
MLEAGCILLVFQLELDPGNFFLHGWVGFSILDRSCLFLDLSHLGGRLEKGRQTNSLDL